MNTKSNSDVALLPPLAGSPSSEWTIWPEVTGPQFIALPGEIWVGTVELGREDPEHGRKVVIWKGSGHYVRWESQATKWKFRFQKIAWPQNPWENACEQEPAPEQPTICCASSEPIHDWFSLSYASYLVIPRTILQSCTPENQQRLVDALDAIYDETMTNMDEQWPHEAVIEVKLKDCATGRYRKDDLANYERGRRRLWHNGTAQTRAQLKSK